MRNGRGSVARRAAACWLVLAGCHTKAPEPFPLAPRKVVELERFDVQRGSQKVGHLVHREIQDPAGPVRYYLAETASGQWLGYIDGVGRVYRYEPFADQEQFLGMYPMEQGLQLLYGAGALQVRAQAQAQEASAPRSRE